jgi:type I site-specific restriction endonuclease
LFSQMVGRGTRIADGKDHLLVLDPVWIAGKLRLASSANLTAHDELEEKRIAAKLEAKQGEAIDLLDIVDEVEVEAHAGLLAALERNKKSKAKLFDPLEFAAVFGARQVAEYEPEFAWEREPMTAKQIEILERQKINIASISGKGQASKIIDAIFARNARGMATPAQVKTLTGFGIKNAARLTRVDASEQITACFARAKQWRKK